MFDLDKEINAWCRSIYSNGWKQAPSVDELKDHLYCEIERLSGEGLSEEQAFFAATERIGNVEDLRIEHAKNRTLLSSCSDLLLACFQISSGGPNMSAHTKKPLLPTITCAIGMLLGGLLGAVGGSFAANESVVVTCYILGCLGGAVAGAVFGWRWHARRNRDAAHSQ